MLQPTAKQWAFRCLVLVISGHTSFSRATIQPERLGAAPLVGCSGVTASGSPRIFEWMARRNWARTGPVSCPQPNRVSAGGGLSYYHLGAQMLEPGCPGSHATLYRAPSLPVYVFGLRKKLPLRLTLNRQALRLPDHFSLGHRQAPDGWRGLLSASLPLSLSCKQCARRPCTHPGLPQGVQHCPRGATAACAE